MNTVRFRHSPAAVVAAIIAFCGSIPVAAVATYLIWLPVIPLVVLVWALRSGTRADAEGLSVRALVGTRRERWTDITGFSAPDGRHTVALLANGSRLRLVAVGPGDLPRLAAASGHLDTEQQPAG